MMSCARAGGVHQNGGRNGPGGGEGGRRKSAGHRAVGAGGRPRGPLMDKGEFDGRKFSWIGSITDDVSACVTWHTSPVKTWADALATNATFGGEGAGSDPDIFTLLYKNVFGAKMRLVTGYPGTND